VRYNTNPFCASVFSDVEQNLCDGKRGKMLRGIHVHLDDAPAHKAKRSQREITQTKADRTAHPAYSPDGAPGDFFLCIRPSF
jgi:hypothetical protein